MNIFGLSEKKIPYYGILGVIGMLCGFIYILIRCKGDKNKLSDVTYTYVWAILFALLGAKILYIITDIPNIISKAMSAQSPIFVILSRIATAGFVFYGGLYGSIIGTAIACKYFGLERAKMLDILLPTLPLVHAFGRLGCLSVGCCYGKETSIWPAIVYTHSDYAPNGVNLIPVQLYEAIFEFLMFILLAILLHRFHHLGKSSENLLFMYLSLYSIFRFILEFFRGDEIRGIWLGLSTSQWISIITICVTTIHHFIGDNIKE